MKERLFMLLHLFGLDVLLLGLVEKLLLELSKRFGAWKARAASSLEQVKKATAAK